MKDHILFYLLIFPIFAFAQEELQIIQPEKISGIEDITPVIYHWATDQKDRENIFLGPPKNSILFSEDLFRSRERLIFKGGKPLFDQFWKLFVDRANELNVSPLEGTRVLFPNKLMPYDTELDTNFDQYNNPVQNFLRGKMGFDRVKSRDIYTVTQIGYILGGISGAQMAWDEFLIKELNYITMSLAGDLGEFEKIKSIELFEFIPANYDETEDSVERIMEILKNGNPLFKKYIISLLHESGQTFDIYNDSEKVKKYFLDNWKTLSQKNIFGIIFGSADKNKRYIDGIRAESEGRGHYYGPASRLSQINRKSYDVLRLLLWKGVNLSQAQGFLDYVLSSDHHQIVENRHNEPFNQLWEIYKKEIVKTCEDLLKK